MGRDGMHSEGLAYEETLPAHAEGLPAYGEAPPVAAADEVAEPFDRRKDWPLAFVIFTPVIAAYAVIGYGIYLAANAIA
jgi:hypothetical protein